MSDPTGTARETWDEHYSAKPQVWSGRVNAQLAGIAGELTPGRALDLGCGEGGDAVWLAEHGWTVVAADVSAVALDRARAAALDRGVEARIDFVCTDFEAELPDGPFDLVSAQFLHSTVALDRPAILRRAAQAVAPGGSLLIVDHAAAPPWATRMHHHDFPTAEQVVAGLKLDPATWERVRVESVERTAVGPDGAEASLVDNVIWLRKVA